ncbi:MAG TPA: AsmA family protein [Gammaproteobacteria bacterium]|nr:AsmA family protein [Gammaproteobacteria bacterium]
MGRALKFVGILVAVIVVLFIGVGVYVTTMLDPNDYKDQISQAVADATGRQLTLEGDLEFGIFPSLRLAVGPAELSNAEGFADVPFARIGGAELSVGLFPLLSDRLEIERASLSGLELNLARDSQGRNNWQDMATASGAQGDSGAAADDSAPSGTSATGNFTLGIGSVEIADARVSWSDAQTGEDWVLDDFTLLATDLGEGTAFPLEIAFALSGDVVDVDVESSMNATLNIAGNSYTLEDLAVEIDGSGSAWPGGEGTVDLAFERFIADLAAETLSLEGLELRALGLDVTGTLAGRNLLGDLELEGGVTFAQFDPRDLMDVFEVAIETADADVLGSASAQAQFAYSPAAMALNDLRLTLDDSTLQGRVAIVGERFDFDLDIDDINIDRYLPPAAEDASADDEGSVDEVDLPVQMLRNFTSNGNLSFASTKFMNLTFTNASFDLRAGDGRLRITPSADFYGGRISGSLGIDVVSETAARLSIVQNIEGFDIAPFARDFLESEQLSGTGQLSLDVAATGSNVGEINRDLDGDVAFAFTDGAWEGFDVWYELRRLSAVASGESAPGRPAGPPRTPFESISATGVVEDSLLTNRDLSATLQYLSLNGTGTVNLLTDAMNFDLTAQFPDSAAFEEAPELENLAGAQLPLTVTGTLAAPSIRPDFGAVVRARVQQEVDSRAEEVQTEVDERVEEEKEELRDRVRDRLRGIFD